MADEKSKRRKTTAAELPEEVVREEILTRLPIKLLVRFKCVAKSWLSLFSYPLFVKWHLTYSSTQNSNEFDCLIAKKKSRIAILSRYGETLALPIDRFTLIGSINGLVCLGNDKKMSLWNPSIHQSMEFTLPPHRSCCKDNIGFDFDPVNNDYNLVVLSVDKRSASVYSSNYNVFPKNGVNYSSSPTTIVKDCPHWTFGRYTYDYPNDRQFIILVAFSIIAVKFDARSNEFKLLPTFHCDVGHVFEPSRELCYEVVDLKDRLTLILHNRKSRNCMVDIIYLDGEEGCCGWSRIYTLGPLNFHTRGWWVSLLQGFMYGGEMLFYDEGMFSCYDHKTLTTKRLLDAISTGSSSACCFRYTPSLVFLEGMKSVFLTRQTRRTSILHSRTPRRLISSLGVNHMLKVLWHVRVVSVQCDVHSKESYCEMSFQLLFGCGSESAGLLLNF